MLPGVTQMLLASAFLLRACVGFVPDEPPETLTAPCTAPVDLPERAMPQAEVETFWGADRAALEECGQRLALLGRWSTAR